MEPIASDIMMPFYIWLMCVAYGLVIERLALRVKHHGYKPLNLEPQAWVSKPFTCAPCISLWLWVIACFVWVPESFLTLAFAPAVYWLAYVVNKYLNA